MASDLSGPAFPTREGDHDGMSLWEWYAGQALTGITADERFTYTSLREQADSIAEAAAQVADAMLAEAEKRRQT